MGDVALILNYKCSNSYNKDNYLSISCDIALRWMPQDLTGDQSTLIQVMDWCWQATSHYLNQCWLVLWHHMVSLDHNEFITCLQWINKLFRSLKKSTPLLYMTKHWLITENSKWANYTLRPRQNGCHFNRRHFQIHFLEWKCKNFDLDIFEVSSQGSNQYYSSIGSDSGLEPARQQAIIWTNDG